MSFEEFTSLHFPKETFKHKEKQQDSSPVLQKFLPGWPSFLWTPNYLKTERQNLTVYHTWTQNNLHMPIHISILVSSVIMLVDCKLNNITFPVQLTVVNSTTELHSVTSVTSIDKFQL